MRLVVYDRTCTGRPLLPGLTHSWIAGSLLFCALGRIDAFRGVSSWEEALAWLARVEPERPISEIQFWGHGKWGRALVARDVLDERALLGGHPLHAGLEALRARLSPSALLWLRTCESFGCALGQRFARALADFFGCDVAGHTFIIGPWQSGLHRLRPGEEPSWPREEGLVEGSPERPERAAWSGPREPNTITCLHGKIPEGF